jgi:RimJ/RimL family protein N-acetyltransferase
MFHYVPLDSYDWLMGEVGGSEPVIATARLDLHHISATDLVTLFETPDDPALFQGKPYTNPHRVLMDSSGPLRWRVPQVQANPLVNRWFVRWMVERSTGVIVGSLSFHGPPDEEGMVEIGLGVHDSFQRQGFGREALLGMWLWVVNQPGVKKLRYTVDPNNTASVALVQQFGFTNVGQQIDEEDGPEDIYEMSASDFGQRFL